MNKLTGIILTVVAIVGLGLIVLNGNNDDQNNNTQPSSQNTNSNADNESESQAPENELDPNNHTEGAIIGETVDATDQGEVTVDINDFIFETTYLKIKPGTKVTWTNRGNVRHDVTSAESSPGQGLGSELLANGDSYSFTFEEPGLYEYFCTPHPSQMRATVLVEE